MADEKKCVTELHRARSNLFSHRGAEGTAASAQRGRSVSAAHW